MSSERWKDEVNRPMAALHVVDNNGPTSLGGGGKPLQPPAPPFNAPGAAPAAPSKSP